MASLKFSRAAKLSESFQNISADLKSFFFGNHCRGEPGHAGPGFLIFSTISSGVVIMLA